MALVTMKMRMQRCTLCNDPILTNSRGHIWCGSCAGQPIRYWLPYTRRG